MLFSVYKGEFMYIKEIDVETLGPLEKANIKFSFNEDGSPKPLVLVGKNGSGKSTLISNIVDFFMSFQLKHTAIFKYTTKIKISSHASLRYYPLKK